MDSRFLVACSILLATFALAPSAAADGECQMLPKEAQGPCNNLASGRCNGGEKGYEQCLAGNCPQDPATRTPQGCVEYACDSPDWNSTTPYGGSDCLDMLCRNVAPIFATVKVQVAGVAGVLGGLGAVPGVETLRRVLVNAGFYCEKGTGDGGPGSPCQRVLWTPVASVGADPEGIVNTGGESGWECSWVQSGATGYNYVYTGGSEVVLLNGNCAVVVRVTIVMGADRGYYRFTDGCY